jgi:hypothetical protein
VPALACYAPNLLHIIQLLHPLFPVQPIIALKAGPVLHQAFAQLPVNVGRCVGAGIHPRQSTQLLHQRRLAKRVFVLTHPFSSPHWCKQIVPASQQHR